MIRRLVALLALVALITPSGAAAAGCPRTSLSDVEDEVMCVVCGTPLELATEAPQANRERALIQDLVDDCKTKEQVKDRLAAEYGDRVLATPDHNGFDLAAYLVPALVVVLALGAVGTAAVQWRHKRRTGGSDEPPAGPDPASDASRRLQTDLDSYEL